MPVDKKARREYMREYYHRKKREREEQEARLGIRTEERLRGRRRSQNDFITPTYDVKASTSRRRNTESNDIMLLEDGNDEAEKSRFEEMQPTEAESPPAPSEPSGSMEMEVVEEPPPWSFKGTKSDLPLHMEVTDEEPSVDQTTYFMKGERDYQEAIRRVDALMEANGEIVERNDNVIVVQTPSTGPAPSIVTAGGPPGLTAIGSTPVVQASTVAKTTAGKTVPGPGQTLVQVPGGVLLQPQSNVVGRATATTTPAGTYQLFMDPRMGILVGGAVAPSSGTTANTPVVYTNASNARGATQQVVRATVPGSVVQLPNANRSLQVTRTITPITTGGTVNKPLNKVSPWVSTTATTVNSVIVTTAVTTVPAGRGITTSGVYRRGRGRGYTRGTGRGSYQPPPPLAPRSGVTAASTAPVVDLTDDQPAPTRPSVAVPSPRGSRGSPRMNHVRGRGGALHPSRGASHSPDSREVSFSKLGCKLFPSLVVTPKPTLRVREYSNHAVVKERQELDQLVKSVLLFSTTKFTEWLIQKGLVRSEQTCLTHKNPLKLGMYSDISKFPHSGGYVWICDFCSPQLFISVFNGSIFEGAIFEGSNHSPMVLLKLIYHWACQTSVQNINQWVKVDNHFIKTFFMYMRAICTAAISENYDQMGGPSKRVEVGVISLGTAAPDGSSRHVKVEVLGIMDPENKLIRLRAVDPLQEGEKNYKRRFVKILEPMAEWVHKKSIILTDFTVDKGTLMNMGFTSVYQVAANPEVPETNNRFSNINVMNYLRKVVPKMFQNTLSLLSRANIQQFLDELVWRERWGPIPSLAFNNIIQHLAEQTRANTGPSFVKRIGQIAANPFREWKYSSDNEIEVIETRNNMHVTSTAPSGPRSAPSSAPPAPTVAATTAPAAAAATTTAATTSTPSPAPAATPAVVPTVPFTPEMIRPTIDMLPQSIREPSPQPKTTSPTPRRRKRPAEPAQPALPGQPAPKRNAVAKRTSGAPLNRVSTAENSVALSGEANTPLQSYYYGTMEGDPAVIRSEPKSTTTLKCCVCVKYFTNNIQLMKHILMHVRGDSYVTELSDLTQCKYCLQTFATPFAMQTHVDEMHLMESNSRTVCSICVHNFGDTTSLINHMYRTHVALEMPYVCHICQFRSSMHRDLIDHFYEVHNNSEKLQCPFCLKIVAFASGGRRLNANVSFYLAHVQKHGQRKARRKCQRCALWFVSKSMFSDHLQRDHISFKNVSGVKVPKPSESEVIMMPLPPADLGPTASTAVIRRGTARGRHSATYLFTPLEVTLDIPDGLKCCECKEDIDEGHFSGCLLCSRCRYSTCCAKAMTEHMHIFHETPGKPVFVIGKTVSLPSPMFCACGYSSASGNRLIKHLCICERKSAYPNPAKARSSLQSASFPPLVTLDDTDNVGEDPSDRWLKNFVPARKEEAENGRDTPEKKTLPSTEDGPPSMLNLLGLYRKPSTDESSLDKAPSDKEESKQDAEPAKKAAEPAEKEIEPVTLD